MHIDSQYVLIQEWTERVLSEVTAGHCRLGRESARGKNPRGGLRLIACITLGCRDCVALFHIIDRNPGYLAEDTVVGARGTA